MTFPSAPNPQAPRLLSRLEVATPAGSFLGDTRIRLLEAIEKHGSISQAARHVPISYKAAWDAIDAMNNLSPQPLVARSTGGRQGGGTQLTDYGRQVVAMYRAVEQEYQLALDRLSARLGTGESGSLRDFQQVLRRMSLRSSARNQFACTVSGMREGDVDYEIYLRVDADTELVAIIMRDSAEQLGLAIGTEVFALVKASAVLLLTDATLRTSARNQLSGVVSRVHEGPVNAEVILDLGGSKNVTAVVTHDSVKSLGIAVGQSACAVFKASSVILSVIA